MKNQFHCRILILSVCTLAFISLTCVQPQKNEIVFPATENRGTLLIGPNAVRDFPEMVWSPNSDRLYFVHNPLSGPANIRYVNIADKSVVTMDSTSGQYSSICLGPAGDTLYYAYQDAGLKKISICKMAADKPLIRSVVIDSAPVTYPSMILSPDGKTLGLQNRLYNMDSKTYREFGVASGTTAIPVLFSPQGETVYLTDQKCGNGKPGSNSCELGTKILSLAIADLSNTLTATNVAAGGLLLYAFKDSLMLLRKGSSVYDLYIDNVTEGRSSKIWQYSADNVGSYFSWSADGSKIALWTTRCLSASGLFNCESVWSELVVVDIAANKNDTVARSNTTCGQSVFSPDGKKIAFVLGMSLYLAEIP